MRAFGMEGDELERLVDRHIELCELFEGTRMQGRWGIPPLVVMSCGKSTAECLTALVDRALVAYEGSGYAHDPTISALKVALAQEILGMA